MDPAAKAGRPHVSLPQLSWTPEDPKPTATPFPSSPAAGGMSSPRQPLRLAPRTQGVGVGHPSSTVLGEKTGQSTGRGPSYGSGWQELTEMGPTHASQPCASLGLSDSHLRGVNWLQPQGCSRLPDLIFTLGFPGILTQGEPFYLENAARSLATSKIAFFSHSVHSAAEELTRTMGSG